MVVYAKDIIEKIIKSDQETIDSLEKVIDEALKKENYSVPTPANFNARVRNKITQMYETAGWRVTYSCDQRDGDYLYFQPAIPNDIYPDGTLEMGQ